MPKTLRFEIAENTEVHLEPSGNRAVISCTTEDGKTLQLLARYQTVDKIHQELRKLLDR